ncbi:hypothetical protein [Marinobacter caseinilyticus]|uniref:hypothetical protein n=1 Tax=Marinobacter caseinilyticus TaxID=2692195 RepID=UPI001F4546C6|nr:hypothetical protein [Marinobacter caseinilyticus]
MDEKDKVKQPDSEADLSAVQDRVRALTQALVQAEHLPEAFVDTVMEFYLPLASDIARRQRSLSRPLVVGINGAQGTGKSTLALFLQHILTQCFACPCARFSLDDLYLTRSERIRLGQQVHPLLVTRGVPGTHDLVLGNQVIDQLMAAGVNDTTPIPAFDKACDDRAPRAQWPVHEGATNVVLFEGWCVGARAEADSKTLMSPLNSLEANEDSDGRWRHYVNQQLREGYAAFFGRLDMLIMLEAPSMDCVLTWRTLQERKLASKTAGAPNEGGSNAEAPALDSQGSEQSQRLMTDSELLRFIMHYERLTRAMLSEMPGRADVVVGIAEDHRIRGLKWKEMPHG